MIEFLCGCITHPPPLRKQVFGRPRVKLKFYQQFKIPKTLFSLAPSARQQMKNNLFVWCWKFCTPQEHFFLRAPMTNDYLI